jgi:hypothetical protein
MNPAGSRRINDRVEVYWSNEHEYFKGVITNSHATDGWFVEYDDGDVGWAIDENGRLEAHVPYTRGSMVTVAFGNSQSAQSLDGTVIGVSPEGLLLIR